MRSALALMRASFLSAASYRLALVLSFAGLIASVVPLYFVSGALQPVVADSIANEGGEYFAFLMLGLASVALVGAAVSALPGALAGSLGSGTLEALLVTRTPLGATLAGLMAYPLALAAARAAALLIGVAIVGGQVHWGSLPLATVVLALLVLSYVGVGLVGGALIMVFRTSGPLSTAVITASALLGGVYYSTSVIPAWLQDLSSVVPLTYGLRALRMLVLGGAAPAEVLNDVSALTMIGALVFAVGTLSFVAALRHARRAGTLSLY